jgi:hypothetical protein
MLRSYSGAAPLPARMNSALLVADAPEPSSQQAQQAAPQQAQQQQQQHKAEEYVYKDPQGVVQGPFARQDIIDWCVRALTRCLRKPCAAVWFMARLSVAAALQPPPT